MFFNFLLKMTQERLFPAPEDLERLKTFSKRQRDAIYKRLTQLSYICLREEDRRAALRIRNQLLRDTWTEENKADSEKAPQIVPKPSDFLPDTVQDG